MCVHLSELEDELKTSGIEETYRGQAWSNSTGEWAYFACYLDCEKIRSRLQLPAYLKQHTNDDIKSGLEEGFICEKCGDAIMGLHRKLDGGKNVRTIR